MVIKQRLPVEKAIQVELKMTSQDSDPDKDFSLDIQKKLVCPFENQSGNKKDEPNTMTRTMSFYWIYKSGFSSAKGRSKIEKRLNPEKTFE